MAAKPGIREDFYDVPVALRFSSPVESIDGGTRAVRLRPTVGKGSEQRSGTVIAADERHSPGRSPRRGGELARARHSRSRARDPSRDDTRRSGPRRSFRPWATPSIPSMPSLARQTVVANVSRAAATAMRVGTARLWGHSTCAARARAARRHVAPVGHAAGPSGTARQSEASSLRTASGLRSRWVRDPIRPTCVTTARQAAFTWRGSWFSGRTTARRTSTTETSGSAPAPGR